MASSTGIAQVVASAAAASELAATAAPAQQERLRALAAQFESMLLSQMLREMRASMFDDSEDTGFSTGPLSDTLFTELSLALSRAGGVGLGQAVMGPLERLADESNGAASVAAPIRGLADPAVTVRSLADARGNAGEGGRSLSETGLPVPGRVTSGYGWRQDPIDGGRAFHKGTDIALPIGHAVPAARPGQVAFAGELPGYGLTVVVQHDGEMATRYAHLSEATVRAGDVVGAGQVIAKSGASGRATGAHLHFEWLQNGLAVDPKAVIKE